MGKSAFCVVPPESVLLPEAESLVGAGSLAERVSDALGLGVSVALGLGVSVALALCVSLALALGVSVGVAVGDADSVGTSDGELLVLGVWVGVVEDDGEVALDDGVGEVEPRNEHSCCWLVMAAVSFCCSCCSVWVSLVTCCCNFWSWA